MKNYSPILLLLLLPLLAVGLYACFADTWGLTLEKVSLSDLTPWQGKEPADTLADTKVAAADTAVVDTTRQRILLFGDSMVEGLGPRLAEYCNANGYDLTYVCWYSSTSIAWDSDTLHYYMNEAQPTLVMVALGGNEQQTRNLEGTEKHVRGILSRIGNKPCFWICTPAWNKDAPFNDIPKKVFGEQRFYDSRLLTLERASDNKHPTFAAARIWMDDIARWMSSPKTVHPIRMNVPPQGTSKKCHSIYLSPSGKKETKAAPAVVAAPVIHAAPAASAVPVATTTAEPATPEPAPVQPALMTDGE